MYKQQAEHSGLLNAFVTYLHLNIVFKWRQEE